MTINFYQNDSEKEKLEKTLSNEWAIEGTLREPCNLLNPDILIQMPTGSVFIYNYMYIPEFARYYFITGMEVINNKLVRISGHVDVLMTFANYIKEQTATVKRQENNWNLYLNDGFFKTFQNPKIQFKEFPNGFSAPDNYTWVLVTTAS